MRGFKIRRRASNRVGLARPARGRLRAPARWNSALAVAGVMALSLLQLTGSVGHALAATPLNVFVGYMDTHAVPSSPNQPNPWPYTDPSSFVGSPCPNFPNSTACWDGGAVRLDNPGSTNVTGVQVVVVIGSKTYSLWGSSLTVKANGMLVLTETGSQPNSANFDGSDFPPNAYNGGNTASCANSGAIPAVKITIAGVTTTYLDSGQVLNTGGVDGGHCLNGTFVSGRMDESRSWVQIGSSAPRVPTAPQSLAATAGSGSVSLSWAAPASSGGAAITGYNVYRGTSPGGESATPVATNVTTTSFTDTALTNGTTYYYTVAAVNSVGTSPQSNEASATPVAVQATVPSAPQSLAAVAGNSSVSLSWSAPASDGGSPVTGYNVYRGTSAGGESATPVASNISGTTFTDTGLVNGTTYFYTVAAVNAVGTSPQSAEVSATPQAPGAVAFVRRLGSSAVSGNRTTISVSVGSPGGAAGDTLVVSLLLSSTTHLTTAIPVTDTAGNSYVVGRDVNDGSAGDRTVVFVSTKVKALAAGSTITLTYPSSAETHVSVDEFSGIAGIDTSAGATGTTSSFSSGTTPATSQASELLIGAVGTESGAAPTWSAGWTALPVLSLSGDYLDTAYRLVTTSGGYAATGTIAGQWMASIVTLKTG
jgi:hypothetical protein